VVRALEIEQLFAVAE